MKKVKKAVKKRVKSMTGNIDARILEMANASLGEVKKKIEKHKGKLNLNGDYVLQLAEKILTKAQKIKKSLKIEALKQKSQKTTKKLRKKAAQAKKTTRKKMSQIRKKVRRKKS